jgi:hypothetical protein
MLNLCSIYQYMYDINLLYVFLLGHGVFSFNRKRWDIVFNYLKWCEHHYGVNNTWNIKRRNISSLFQKESMPQCCFLTSWQFLAFFERLIFVQRYDYTNKYNTIIISLCQQDPV